MFRKISPGFILLILSGYLFAAPEPVSVEVYSGIATVQHGDVTVKLTADPLQLQVFSGDKVQFATKKDNPFILSNDKGTLSLKGPVVLERRWGGFLARLHTSDGDPVQLLVQMDQAKHIVLECIPSESVDSITLMLEEADDEHFYGLGDLWYTESVDMKGAKVDYWDEVGTPDECSYVPYYMSTKGYGIFMDTGYRGWLDFGDETPGTVQLKFEAPSLSCHLWVGETFKEILPQYLNMTGYPYNPPEWTFLPQKWRDEGTWDDVFEDVALMEKHGCPLGCVWLDRPWAQGSYGSDDFIFDSERYPDPEAALKKLHDKGIRLIVWGCDFLREESRYYEEGLEKGYYVGGFGTYNKGEEDRHIVDLANPEAREWFKGIIKNALKTGVDGYKIDRGQRYPINVTPPSGRDPKAMHNYHAHLLVKVYAEALMEERGDDFQLTPRAGWTGTHAWTMKWPGDMESTFDLMSGLPAVVRAQSAAGLTGFAYWGSDVGGYTENLSKEVFVRWLQHGVFSPIMQLSGKNDFNLSPFAWDDETTEIYKFYANFRANMVPYMKAMAEKSHKEGVPMVRHLAWEFPDDPNVHDQDYSYYFGDDLFVHCIVEKSRKAEFYLPEGEWVDFWDRDRVIEGPKQMNEKTPLWKMPIFIRKGSTYSFEMPEIDIQK